MRWIFLAFAMACALVLLLDSAPRLVASLLRAPGDQAADLAVVGAGLRPEGFRRAVISRERSQAWSPARRALIELGYLHFNFASRAPAGSPEQVELLEQSLEALREGLRLSPVQPIAWLLAAGAYHDLEAWPEAARALEWAVRTGPYMAGQHRTRTIIGLRVWHLVDARTRRLLLNSVRATLLREPDLVARAAIAASIENDLGIRLGLLQEDGAALAEQFRQAVDRQRGTL